MELPQPDTHCHDDDTGLSVWSYSHDLVRSIVAAAIAEERAQWMDLACAGLAVLQGPDKRAQSRTSHQNVSDTLDALVRVVRARSAPRTQEG